MILHFLKQCNFIFIFLILFRDDIFLVYSTDKSLVLLDFCKETKLEEVQQNMPVFSLVTLKDDMFLSVAEDSIHIFTLKKKKFDLFKTMDYDKETM